MRAAWGHDQSMLPKEPAVSAPGMRVSEVILDNELRDPKVPDGTAMTEGQLDHYLRTMKKYAGDKELNLTHTFQSSAGNATGIIAKPRFRTALGMLFHQYPLTEDIIASISFKFGCGPPDPHGGGYMEVMWRAFVLHLRDCGDPEAPPVPNFMDARILLPMSELRQIAEDCGLDMRHCMLSAGGRANGVILKTKFFMALTSQLFPHYHFSSELLSDVALIYANTSGPADLRSHGGYQEVLWRQFITDVGKVPLPRELASAGGY